MSSLARSSTQQVTTPLWRRVTALFTLGTMVILGGLAIGALIALTALLLNYLVESAIA